MTSESDHDDLEAAAFDGVERADLRAEGVAVGSRRRTLLQSLSLYAPVAYAGAVVVREGKHALPLRVALAVAPLVFLRRASAAIDDLPSSRASARAALVFAVVAAVLACGGADTTPSALAAVVAASLAVVCALPGLEAIVGLGGVLRVRPTPRRPAVIVVALAWVVCGALEATRVLAARGVLRSAAWSSMRAVTLVGAFEIIVTAVTIGHIVWARRRRRLELGAVERHDLLLGVGALILPVAVAIATSLDPFAAALSSSSLLVAPALAFACASLLARLVRDPIAGISVVARAWISVVFGAVAWVTVEMWAPTTQANVALLATALGAGVGLGAQAVARSLGLIDAFAPSVRSAVTRARDAASTTDPREVERGTLVALRALSGAPTPRIAGTGVTTPRLLTFAPLREISLDAAGEPRERDPSPPSEPASQDPDAPAPVERVVPRALLELLGTEPLGVVRTEVLRALEVRRPDLRGALAWCDRNDAVAVVALMIDGELEGLLTMPAGREAPVGDAIGLVHARALRAIARILSARIALHTQLVRAAARTQRAERHAREVDTLLERASERESRLSRAVSAGARPWADSIALGGYAPTARSLRAQLDALSHAPTHLVVLHRPGTDPTAYAARMHVEGKRRGALQVVDAARREDVEPRKWNDPVDSPLERARDGTLLVRDAHRTPPEVQQTIVRALAFRTGPANDPVPLDVRVVLAVACDDPEHDDGWRAAISPPLAGRLHEPPLRVPPLARRLEDVRAIALDRLAVHGVAKGGEPMGISEEAIAALVEHEWPGDDAELDVVLLVAARQATGKRVEAADIRDSLRGCRTHASVSSPRQHDQP